MNCPTCNALIPDRSKFCGHCGAAISAAERKESCAATDQETLGQAEQVRSSVPAPTGTDTPILERTDAPRGNDGSVIKEVTFRPSDSELTKVAKKKTVQIVNIVCGVLLIGYLLYLVNSALKIHSLEFYWKHAAFSVILEGALLLGALVSVIWRMHLLGKYKKYYWNLTRSYLRISDPFVEGTSFASGSMTPESQLEPSAFYIPVWEILDVKDTGTWLSPAIKTGDNTYYCYRISRVAEAVFSIKELRDSPINELRRRKAESGGKYISGDASSKEDTALKARKKRKIGRIIRNALIAAVLLGLAAYILIPAPTGSSTPEEAALEYLEGATTLNYRKLCHGLHSSAIGNRADFKRNLLEDRKSQKREGVQTSNFEVISVSRLYEVPDYVYMRTPRENDGEFYRIEDARSVRIRFTRTVKGDNPFWEGSIENGEFGFWWGRNYPRGSVVCVVDCVKIDGKWYVYNATEYNREGD